MFLHRNDRTRKCRASEATGQNPRAAFTLVEMLIAVGLIVLIMSLFAEVFQIAAGSMSKLRGIAENDQRSRSITIVLRADLDKRTFRYLLPYAANEDKPPPVGIASQYKPPTNIREGYFYISENDPNNDTDDILQFTMRSTINTKNRDQTPYYGRATHQLPTAVPDFNGNGTAGDVVDQAFYFVNFPNQPDADDGQQPILQDIDLTVDSDGDGITSNDKDIILYDDTASSSAAEVSYFVRNGNLYRRVLLIREPLPLVGASAQPTLTGGFNFFDQFNAPPPGVTVYPNCPPNSAANPGNFWADFDFSAYLKIDLGTGSVIGATFNGVSSLANETNNPPPITEFAALAHPRNRFGFNPFNPVNFDAATGRSREYLTTGGPFLGRFTHEETSSSNFRFPHNWATQPAANYNPMNVAAATPLTLNSSGAVASYASGSRQGEDLLLPNVLSFDIKVWDDRYNEDANSNGILDAGEDVNGNGLLETAGGFVNIGYGPPATGDYSLAKRTTVPGYNAYGPNPTGVSNNVFDTWHPQVQLDLNGDGKRDDLNANGVFGGLDTGDDYPPPYRPAADYGPDGRPGRANIDDDGNGITDFMPPWVPGMPPGVPDPGETGWWGSDDFHPLRAIQITIRYRDVTSNQIRQLTIQHSLID